MKRMSDAVNPPGNIDLHRLAGFNRVLGVDLTDRMIRIVELEKRGRILNRFAASFSVVGSSSYELNAAERREEVVKRVRNFIRENTTTSRAVTSVRGVGIKTVSVLFPQSVENIEEWIGDHYEDLVKLPLPLQQVVFGYEILQSTGDSPRVEVTFVRKADAEKHLAFCRDIGLEIMGLSAGVKDSLNALLTERREKNVSLVHADRGVLFALSCKNGSRLPIRIIHGTTLAGVAEAHSSRFMCGEVEEIAEADGWQVFRPFGLSPEYALAAGLAVRGFIPEMNSVDFRDAQSRTGPEKALWKSLTRRAIVAVGTLLVLLLAIPLGLSAYFQYRLESMEEELAEAGPVYHDLSALEDQVKQLEARMNDGDPMFRRTQFARVLHDVAASTSDSLWLYRISADGTNGDRTALTLGGFARSSSPVTAFMKDLRSSGPCSSVSLLRSGVPLQSETFVPVAASMHTFEIHALVKE